MKIRDLTRSEADYLQAVCNFTKDENTLFELRLEEEASLEECAEKMSLSVPTAKRIHDRVKKKIEKEI